MEKNPYLKAVAAVLFAAVCAWLWAGLFPGLRPGPPPSAAGRGEKERCLALEGIALREEQALYLPERAGISAAPGERIPAGAVVAVWGDGQRESEKSAVFFDSCDGYEQLSPEDARPLSPERVEALLNTEPAEPGQARLVSGFEWYYAAVAEHRGTLPEGDYRLRFPGLEAPVEARLLETSRDGEGRQALLFRIRLGDVRLLELRRCRAELILP